jgi:hypothetical protein
VNLFDVAARALIGFTTRAVRCRNPVFAPQTLGQPRTVCVLEDAHIPEARHGAQNARSGVVMASTDRQLCTKTPSLRTSFTGPQQVSITI